MRIESVLAASDFSSGARHAMERAAMLALELAIQRGALLHVLEKSWIDSLKQFIGSQTKIDQEILDKAEKSLSESDEKNHRPSNFSFEPIVRMGNVLDTILEVASDFDLLVLGAHGQHPVKSLAIGTTSQRLLSKIKKPILVVKRKPETSYKHVFVAVDFSNNSLKALACSHVIAPRALVYAVHVFEPLFEGMMRYAGVTDEIIKQHRVKAQIEAEIQMINFIKKAGVKSKNWHRLIEYGHAPTKLPEMTQNMNPDLIIVGKHGRSRVEELLLGSITLHMLSQASCDVLVT